MAFQDDDVTAVLHVEYGGTVITKSVTVRGNDTDAVKINRAIEHLTRQIQIMVQSSEGVK